MIDLISLGIGLITGAGVGTISAAIAFAEPGSKTQKEMIIAAIPLIIVGLVGIFIVR